LFALLEPGDPAMSEVFRQHSETSSAGAHPLDQVCARFAAAWEAGPAPRIEDFLTGSPGPPGDQLLRRLITLDLAYRCRRGERPRADDYRLRFPGLDLDWLNNELLTQPLTNPMAVVPTPTLPSGEARPDDPGRLLCCPQCHNVICLPPGQIDGVYCPDCGSSFRVEGAGPGSTLGEVRSLGRFQLLEQVGRGTFGSVWRARDTQLDRIVALKVPHPSLLTSQVYRERFQREARAAAQLRHPGIVRLYEVATLEPGPVLVSDFIDGLPLKELLEVRRLTFREAAALVAEVAEALDYAHDQGLVHRDIKPANIMVEAAPATGPHPRGLGRPILVDFGLALREEAEIVLTVEGQVIGTPAYMSPEQAAGQGHRVDRRSDLYSLGVVLYQLLCGELPFRGSRAMLLHQVLEEEPRPPRRLNDKIPRDLETVCLKAMAKEPGWRYATAGELAADLRRFLRGEPIQARPVGRAERLVRWARRNPALAAVSCLAASALAAVVAGSVLFVVKEIQHGHDLGAALRLSEDHRRQAEYRLAENYLDRALAQVAPADSHLRMAWLARALEATPEEAPELEQVIRVNLAAGHPFLCPVRALLSHAESVTAAAFNPDGRTVVTVSADGRVHVWDALTGSPLGEPLSHPGSVTAVGFRPDGKILVTGGADGTVRFWNATTWNPLGIELRHGGKVLAVAFGTDDHTVATAGSDGTAQLWDAETGKRGPVLKHGGSVRVVAFNRDGRRILTGSTDGTVRLWDAARGTPEEVVLRHAGLVEAATFSPDGRTILTGGSGDGMARLWDAAGGRLLRSLPHQADVAAAVFSPDGKLILTGSYDKTAQLWQTSTGQRLGPPLRHAQPPNLVAFRPDGRRILTGGHAPIVQFRDIPSAWHGNLIIHASGAVSQVLFSPDGKLVLTVSNSAGKQGEAQVWEAATGKPRGAPVVHPEMIWAATFSPDGQTVLTAGADNRAGLLSLRTGQPRSLPHQGAVSAAAFRRDGEVILTASQDRTVRLWNADTGEALGEPLVHESPVLAAVFSPDGQYILTGCADGKACVWDAARRALVHTLVHRKAVVAVAFSPDGNTLLTASYDNTARLWARATGAPVGDPLSHEDHVYAVTFSPDGQVAATASLDGTARLWAVATSRPLGPPLAHGDSVYAVAFSPDSRTLATGSRDQTARLWDVRTSRALGPPLSREGSVRGVTFDPAGRTLLTGSEDGTACLWPVPGPIAGSVPRVQTWVQVLTGMELDRSGAVHLLNARDWQQLRRRLDDLGGAPLP
jgi:WD40 repeat protein